MYIPHFFVFLLFYITTTRAQYSGYNAAGRNSGWRSGSEHDPLDVPNVYHKPNEYENQPHSYWYENKPFPHAHNGHPGTYTGKLHRHRPDDDIGQGHHFITDPPNVGLNSPNQKDNFKGSASGAACDPSNPYDSSGCSSSSSSGGSSHFSVKSAHAIDEDIDADNETTTATPDTKIVSLHATDIITDEGSGSEPKKQCCACCQDDDEAKAGEASTSPTPARALGTTISVPVQVYPTTLSTPSPSFGSFVKGGAGGYASSSGYYPSSAAGQSYQQNTYGYGQSCGGCGDSSCGSSYSSGCCGGNSGGCCGQELQLPSCCLPQLPCCPKIEFPCCPQQPICCQPQGCGVCRSRVLKQRRTKRFGCIQCAGRRKREVLEEIHVRRKRLFCVPCLRRHKREQPRCRRCSPFTTRMVQRVKRKACIESNNRHSGSVNSSRPTWKQTFGVRSKRDTFRDSEDFDSDSECDKSCCDYSKCVRPKTTTVSVKH